MLFSPKTVLRWAGGIFLGVFFIFVGVFAYYLVGHTFFPAKPTPLPQLSVNVDGKPSQPGDTRIVYVQGKTEHTREVVYMPKETDPATGEVEKTDVGVTTKTDPVVVKVNDKEFVLDPKVDEVYNFENGKLVINETQSLNLEITAPKFQWEVGLGYGNHGVAFELGGPLYKNLGFWVYADSETYAGGLKWRF